MPAAPNPSRCSCSSGCSVLKEVQKAEDFEASISSKTTYEPGNTTWAACSCIIEPKDENTSVKVTDITSYAPGSNIATANFYCGSERFYRLRIPNSVPSNYSHTCPAGQLLRVDFDYHELQRFDVTFVNYHVYQIR
jgi:hypothetical protein